MKVTVCIGSSCHIKGSRQIVEQLQYLIAENNLGDKILKLFYDLTGAFNVAGTADTYGYFHCSISLYPYS